ncbi:MAG: hypothetical protein JWO97_891 [Acidobacteria bacterium]|nr:hypothetical protein [Acidobacteriota bacterium]
MRGSRLALALVALGIPYTLSAQSVAEASRTMPHTGARIGSNSVLTWDSGAFQYDGSGNIKAIGTNAYVYDTAGRLVSGTATGPANREVYAYDAAGNRLSAALTPGSTPCSPNVGCSESVSVDPATNHLTGTGIQYDEAGNLVAKDATAYVYDAVKMLTRRDDASAVYIYTAGDERLATIVGGGNWKWTVRNLDGKVLREFTGSDASSAQWSRDYVYRGSQLLATQTSAGLSRYHLDQLGTPRLITDANNTRVGQHDYYPFGTELSSSLNEPSAISAKFTGHERDVSINGSNLDYMHARYYNGGQARFLTVDPKTRQIALEQPQLYNRYSYAMNSPLNFVDLDGEDVTPVRGLMTGGKAKIAYVDSRMVPRLQNLVATAHKHGVSFTFSSMLRTQDQQNATVTGNTKNNKGTSPHTAGLAVDINVSSSLKGTNLAGLTTIARGVDLSPLNNQAADPPHFQANDLITRGKDGKVDDQFKALVVVNQQQVEDYEKLRKTDPGKFEKDVVDVTPPRP